MGLWDKLAAAFRKRDATAAAPAPKTASPSMKQPARDHVMSQAASIRIDVVGTVYGRSLIELADETGQLDAIAEEVEQLLELVQGDADLRNLLSNPAIGKDKRAAMVQRVFENNVSDLLYRFMQVLNRKDRLASLEGVCAAFLKLLDEKRGIVTVDAYVAEEMPTEQLNAVADAISQAMGFNEVIPRQHVDANLIGGLKLRVGDHMVDASVATQLKRIARQVADKGRERAREMAASL